jgi:hypothetical protein
MIAPGATINQIAGKIEFLPVVPTVRAHENEKHDTRPSTISHQIGRKQSATMLERVTSAKETD